MCGLLADMMDTLDQFLGQYYDDEPLVISDDQNGVERSVNHSCGFLVVIGQSKSCDVGKICLLRREKVDCHGAVPERCLIWCMVDGI